MIDPLRIEFVCTANIARSPYAERAAASMADPRLVRFSSSGVSARPGFGMDELMAAELRRRGVSPGRHASRPLDEAVVAAADLVLTMEAAQRQRILDHWPDSIRKTFTWTQFMAVLRTLPEGPTGRDSIAAAFARRGAAHAVEDITDPHHRGAELAGRVAQRLDDLAWELVLGLGLVQEPRRAILRPRR